jgi:two-component sensor histidine kinase
MKKQFRQLIIRIRKYMPCTREVRNEYKRILLVVQTTLVGMLACISFAIVDMIHGLYLSMIQDLSALMVFGLAIFMIRNGKFNIGKLMVILYASFTLIVNASRDGRYSGNEFLWFPILGAVFLFFSPKEKIYITVCFTMAFSGIFFLEYTDYSYLHTQMIPGYNYINYVLCFCVTASLVCLYMMYLIKVNTDSEKKLERLNHTLLIRNENLKKTNNELDSFVYKASHDMRAPLTSLLGLIDISKRETDPMVLNNFLELQAKSIRKLDSYIVDILNISRNARMSIQESKIDFKEMIKQIYDQLHYIENSGRVKKNSTIEGEKTFVSDPIRLNIILNNLISNSIRYADLSKEEPFISITIKIGKEFAEITVYDNGTGIEKEHINKIFDMFYRGTETNNGSGLGLYIVKETLNRIKGTISIKSEAGKYTEVRVVVPNKGYE